VPVWSFRYFPTQDGPAHLVNALILKGYGVRGTRYHEFFELRREQFPNWTSYLILAVLLHFVSAPVAEKLLVSGYIVGFAAGLWYFLGAFGRATRQLWPAGMLFAFNFGLLMGFYNWCLSVPVFLFLAGYSLRCSRVGCLQACVLAAGLLLEYFTHLVGYLVTLASVILLLGSCGAAEGGGRDGTGSLLSSGRRVRAAGGLGIMAGGRVRSLVAAAAAAAPSLALLAEYLWRTGFFAAEYWSAMWRGVSWRWSAGNWLAELEWWLTRLNDHFYAAYERWLPLGCLVLLLLEALTLASLLWAAGDEADGVRVRRWPVALLAAALAVAYLVVPNDWQEQGGYLKCRLVLLVPLLWLGCLRAARLPLVRRSLAAVCYVLIGLNLAMFGAWSKECNESLAEYTGGIEAAGYGQVLFVSQGRQASRPLVDPLEHAADYYCFGTGNVNLDNYQAERHYFPVKFRPGLERGRGDLFSYGQQAAVEVVVVWGVQGLTSLQRLAREYREVYREGRLRVFRRR